MNELRVQNLSHDFADTDPAGEYREIREFTAEQALWTEPETFAGRSGRTLAEGDNGWLGTANWGVDYTVIGAKTIWYVQVAALVLGHVAGLVLAHDRALKVFVRAREATRSQYWMLVVMVAFTSLGLWLLSVR